MKLKKILAIICVLAIMCVMLVSCADKQEDAVETPVMEQEVDSSSGEGENGAFHETEAETAAVEFGSDGVFYTETTDGGVSITGCEQDPVDMVIPEKINGADVVGISMSVFYDYSMHTLTLPDSVEYIDDAAFMDCAELSSVDLGKGLKRIGMMSLSGCNQLSSVTFPDGIQEFGDCVFAGCSALKEVYIPASAVVFGTAVIDVDSCPNAVVVTPAGSAAEQHCIENNIPYRNK